MVSPGLHASARDGFSNATYAGIEITVHKKAAIKTHEPSEVENEKKQ